MQWKLFLVPAFAVLVGCSDSASDSVADTSADTDEGDVIYADGPITTRPDDGTETVDATADTKPDALDAEAAADSASDAATDVADVGTGPSAIRIGEVRVDVAVEGSKVEFVELRGPAGTPVNGLTLRVISASGAVKSFSVGNAGDKTKASGLWVVGLASLLEADKGFLLSDGWDLPDSGALQLVGPGDALLDVVAWTAIPTAPSSAPTKVVEGTAAVKLPTGGTTGKSIGRTGADTDDNAKDFCILSQTPGAANGPCS
ncbi:MAG: hypothetical protein IPJ34_05650 [Myxococcales bacterium]|nr:hypothetical protein [Myxococcales bacterium]